MAKTGGGHLRGSPTAQNACLVGRIMTEKTYLEFNDNIAKLITSHLDQSGHTVPDWGHHREFRVDYCFLNFDDADLNPNNG
jgi:hypothetical protein